MLNRFFRNLFGNPADQEVQRQRAEWQAKQRAAELARIIIVYEQQRHIGYVKAREAGFTEAELADSLWPGPMFTQRKFEG